jgi:hypothetical protein
MSRFLFSRGKIRPYNAAGITCGPTRGGPQGTSRPCPGVVRLYSADGLIPPLCRVPDNSSSAMVPRDLPLVEPEEPRGIVVQDVPLLLRREKARRFDAFDRNLYGARPDHLV